MFFVFYFMINIKFYIFVLLPKLTTMKNSNRINKFLKHFFKWTYFLHYPFFIIILIIFIYGIISQKYNIGLPFLQAKMSFSEGKNINDLICTACPQNLFEVLQLTIYKPTNTWIEFFGINIWLILTFFVSILMFKKLYLLFKNVVLNKVFVLENIKLIRDSALLFIIYGVTNLIVYCVMQIYIRNSIKDYSKIPIDYFPLEEVFKYLEFTFLGLILFSLYQVFKRGVELQQLENETV